MIGSVKIVSMVRVCFVCTLSLFIMGCYDSFSEGGESVYEDVEANITIEQLHMRVADDGYLDIEEESAVKGVVTAHDKGGNFYKSFVIESGGYALEVMEGLTGSYVLHQEGFEVAVRLNGLRLARYRGVLQVGVPSVAGSYGSVDYLEHKWLVDQHVVNCGYIGVVEPREVTLAQIYGGKVVNGTLIKVSGLTYSPSVNDIDRLWSGDRAFVDSAGGEIWSYCSSYSDFSEVAIPDGEVALTGILQSDNVVGGARYYPVIKMRSIYDCSD